MKLHGNARLSPKGTLLMCRRVLEEGWSLTAAASAGGVRDRTASKWIGRYRVEGEAGLVDRSSAPMSSSAAALRGLIERCSRDVDDQTNRHAPSSVCVWSTLTDRRGWCGLPATGAGCRRRARVAGDGRGLPETAARGAG